MNSQPTSQRPVVLVCCCEQAKAVPSETVNEIIEKLAQTDAFELVVVPDLCELAARRDPRLAQWAARPRAYRGLFFARSSMALRCRKCSFSSRCQPGQPPLDIR